MVSWLPEANVAIAQVAATGPDELQVAAVSMEPGPNPAANLADLTAWAETVAGSHPDVDVIAFGETILGRWYEPVDPERYQRRVAQPIPGPATDVAGRVAARLNTHIVFGMAEAGPNGALFNSYVLIGPSGHVIATHRKVNLTQEDVRSGFSPGAGPTVAQVSGVPVALLICADADSPAVVAETARLRPRLILQGLATSLQGEQTPRYDPVARATGAWLVFTNRTGAEGHLAYSGYSFVADPMGAHLAEHSAGEGYLYAAIPIHAES